MSDLKDRILSKQDLAREELHVPEWGETVLVWELSGQEFADYQASLTTMKQEIKQQGKKRQSDFTVESHIERAMVRACLLSLKDENGVRLFKDSEERMLGAKSKKALERIFEVADRLSGLTAGAEDDEGKDSASDPSDDGSSVLPATTDTLPSEPSSES